MCKGKTMYFSEFVASEDADTELLRKRANTECTKRKSMVVPSKGTPHQKKSGIENGIS